MKNTDAKQSKSCNNKKLLKQQEQKQQNKKAINQKGQKDRNKDIEPGSRNRQTDPLGGKDKDLNTERQVRQQDTGETHQARVRNHTGRKDDRMWEMKKHNSYQNKTGSTGEHEKPKYKDTGSFTNHDNKM